MGKYIDADILKAEIERYKQGAAIARFDNAGENADYFQGKVDLCDDLTRIITSLQQEQPESSKGKFVFPNFLYARTVDNKTIDVSYAPQSIDAVEYIKNVPIEQPNVDLEEEMDRFFEEMPVYEHENIFEDTFQMIARHFWNKGYTARKEE